MWIRGPVGLILPCISVCLQKGISCRHWYWGRGLSQLDFAIGQSLWNSCYHQANADHLSSKMACPCWYTLRMNSHRQDVVSTHLFFICSLRLSPTLNLGYFLHFWIFPDHHHQFSSSTSRNPGSSKRRLSLKYGRHWTTCNGPGNWVFLFQSTKTHSRSHLTDLTTRSPVAGKR